MRPCPPPTPTTGAWSAEAAASAAGAVGLVVAARQPAAAQVVARAVVAEPAQRPATGSRPGARVREMNPRTRFGTDSLAQNTTTERRTSPRPILAKASST